MLKNHKLVSVSFLLFFGFTLVLFLPGFQIIETAWSEPNASSDNQKEDPEIMDSQSLGAFRGWSPSIPYGENFSDSTNQLNLSKNPLADVKNSPSGKETKPDEPSRTENSPVNQEVDEPFGAFRGWSPAVPYGN